MADYFNEDFRDFLKAFNNHNVEYILVATSIVCHRALDSFRENARLRVKAVLPRDKKGNKINNSKW